MGNLFGHPLAAALGRQTREDSGESHSSVPHVERQLISTFIILIDKNSGGSES